MRPRGIVGGAVLLRLDASVATVAGRLRLVASPGSSSSSESENGMFSSPTKEARPLLVNRKFLRKRDSRAQLTRKCERSAHRLPQKTPNSTRSAPRG